MIARTTSARLETHQFNRLTDNPLQLDEPTTSTLQERESTDTDDDRYGDSLCPTSIRQVGPGGR